MIDPATQPAEVFRKVRRLEWSMAMSRLLGYRQFNLCQLGDNLGNFLAQRAGGCPFAAEDGDHFALLFDSVFARSLARVIV
jgi:hypothetical protein